MSRLAWLWSATFWLGLAVPACALAADPFTLYRHCDLTFQRGNRRSTLGAVPVAMTPDQQQRGLSGMAPLTRNAMLFVWATARPRVVWMHRTRMPLAAAFMDQGGSIFQVTPMQPETDTFHTSARPAVALLEMDNRTRQASGIGVGWRMVHRVCFGAGRPTRTY